MPEDSKKLQNVKSYIFDLSEKGAITMDSVDDIMVQTKSVYGNRPPSRVELEKIIGLAFELIDKADNVRISKWMRILALVCCFALLALVPVAISTIQNIVDFVVNDTANVYASTTKVLTILSCVFVVLLIAIAVVVSFFMMLNKRIWAARILYAGIIVSILEVLAIVAVSGLGSAFWFVLGYLVFQVALSVYLHPGLRIEREVVRRLRDYETSEKSKLGILGYSEKKGSFIELDFFNLFWIFVICSILGLLVEDVFHVIFVWPAGEWHDRAGLLWGPFSPIYGCGALIMTICLNRFYKLNPLLLLICTTVLGGAFEFFVSWFMELAFGTVAWDYSSFFMNINGRTCLLFATMFGLMGMVWIKWALPGLMRLINCVPWKLRYPVTALCAVLMFFNIIMTVQALDCWSQRNAGRMPATTTEEFYAERYNDNFMAKRFESMTFTDNSVRKNLNQ